MLNLSSCSCKKSSIKEEMPSVFPERYENKVALQQHLGADFHRIFFLETEYKSLMWKNELQYWDVDVFLLYTGNFITVVTICLVMNSNVISNSRRSDFDYLSACKTVSVLSLSTS